MEDNNMYCCACGSFIWHVKVKGFYDFNPDICTLRISGDVKAISIIDEKGDKKRYCIKCASD